MTELGTRLATARLATGNLFTGVLVIAFHLDFGFPSDFVLRISSLNPLFPHAFTTDN